MYGLLVFLFTPQAILHLSWKILLSLLFLTIAKYKNQRCLYMHQAARALPLPTPSNILPKGNTIPTKPTPLPLLPSASDKLWLALCLYKLASPGLYRNEIIKCVII